MEAVHIELPYEGGIIVVLEQLWDELVRKLVFIEYDEGLAVVGPSNQIGVPGIF